LSQKSLIHQDEALKAAGSTGDVMINPKKCKSRLARLAQGAAFGGKISLK
jgi:hypothetical protein